MLTGQPFDDLRALVAQLPSADAESASAVQSAANAKPFAEARGLVDLAAWLAAWQRRPVPALADIHICLLVSSYRHVPQGPAMAADYVAMAAKGRAPVNLLCVDKGVGLRVIEMAPSVPHALDGNWEDRDCMAAIAFGMEAAASGGDMLGLSDFAPGNDVPAVAVVAYCAGFDLAAHAADEPVYGAAATMLSSLALPPDQPLAALRLLGGREIAGAVGAILAARMAGLPVLADGWAALAAVSVLKALDSGAADHVRIAGTDGSAQARLAAALGVVPVVSIPVGTGAGCAVAAALPVFSAALALAGVPDRR
ncbi:MAG: hypothetical protein EP335_18855 [Alphaproteobacteria bacterium]|nr:MAG: hypothetical protein EP335_18855 [Alphaproteobacteria bacterium]